MILRIKTRRAVENPDGYPCAQCGEVKSCLVVNSFVVNGISVAMKPDGIDVLCVRCEYEYRVLRVLGEFAPSQTQLMN